jgi:hypothetical protein
MHKLNMDERYDKIAAGLSFSFQYLSWCNSVHHHIIKSRQV